MIGHYQIRCKGKKTSRLQAITMIDPATGWFEIVQSKTKTADKAETGAWLSGCPWPTKITCDHRSEFLIGSEFQYSIKQECNIEAEP
jgi:hypothetical protein